MANAQPVRAATRSTTSDLAAAAEQFVREPKDADQEAHDPRPVPLAAQEKRFKNVWSTA